jgi:polysaccharide pyruvyl transferase CsaB
MQLRTVRQAIRDSDALLLGGGSLLQDATSLRSLLYYLALIRWGLRAHGRVLLVGQGVGPLRRPLSRWLTGATLRRVPFLSVRDADSARLLQSLGVAQAHVDADLTWALEAQPSHTELDGDALWVGIAPRWWQDAPAAEAFRALCRQLHAEGFRAVLIPMQETQDRSLCELIAAESDAFVLPAPTHPAQLLGVMRSLWGVVAMRLHGAIFAASQGTPVLCVSYDPKVDALAEQLHAPRVGLESLGTELPTAWHAFVAQRDALKAQIEQRVQPLCCAAEALLQRVKAAL